MKSNIDSAFLANDIYKPGTKQDHILAVDDIPDNLIAAQTILEDEGYKVSLVTDGKTALARIDVSPPDLILLDVMMPEMDGYEVACRIRENRKLPYIPILLITASDQSSVVRGLDAGADDFIRKPVDVDELLARVRSLLRLKHSIDERDRTAHLREDFVSRFTHDLRIPLVAANRILKLFQQGKFCEVSPDMSEMLNGMISSNNDLLHMVNTLLEVYRYEAGCKTLQLAPCDVPILVREVVQQLTPWAQEKGLNLGISHPENNGFSPTIINSILVDRVELRRALHNLIGNAVKFTEQGEITVEVATSKPSSSNGGSAHGGSASSAQNELIIRVKDTGPGIPIEEQTTLFERFRQGKHKQAGSGLGLYLTRCIIEMHGGSITVISEAGRGSEFTIRLPAQQAS